jgi:5-methylcytosine-specific restriction endonuclease McrA
MSGKWRGPRTAKDPIYSSAAHKAARAYWKQAGKACSICGRPIIYTANGTYSDWSFHLDHIVPVAVARDYGWTDEQISDISNTRPTHRGCNIKHGARLGQQRQRVKAVRRKVLNTSRVW